MTKPHHIYIHVPFCISKCNYCAFFSRAIAPDWDSYLSSILNEIDFWDKKLGNFDVPTIFFGGGTPSLMPVSVFQKIVQYIGKKFNILPHCEITLESNPGTLDIIKLNDFINNGVNRLSIGVQSLCDSELQFLGRRHSVYDAMILIENALNKKLNINCDFIYGLPNQTVDDVITLCNKINSFGLNHVSMYELTIEKNTPFGKMNLNMPDNETMANMYCAISKTLKLPKYEVSNYAFTHNQCKHNSGIWDGDAYIGIGNGAMGRILINTDWYEQSGGDIHLDKLSQTERATEKIITGMRTIRGVKITDDIKKLLNYDFIKKNSALVNISNNRINATEKGLLILDDLLLKLIK